MKRFNSIRVKLMIVVALTTLCALLVSGSILFVYELSVFKESRINDMSAQVDLLAYSTAPALQFLDENTAHESLGLLRIQPNVSAAAIYDAKGALFVSYTRPGDTFVLPATPGRIGITVSNSGMEVFQTIVLDNAMVGTAFMRADYPLWEKAASFISIQLTVALGAMLVAIIVSVWLQSLITQPILSVATIAREVVSRRQFSKRAAKISDDEVGLLVDAFNDMLHEIESRTQVLETTNIELEREMSERKNARIEVQWLNSQLENRIEQLHEKDRNKDDFLATLAHELRNPLAPIRTGLEIIRKVDDDKREKIYSILERQTFHLIRLVDDLMDVSRISRGKVTLKKQTVMLEEILQVAIEATSELMKQKKHQLTVQLPEQPVSILGDPVRLTQVFLNLLSNAANYTDEGGTITLLAQTHNDELEVSITDNGIGIAAEMLEKVFEAFIQEANPLARPRTGLGIGLTLARALINMHGGSIRAESAGLGQGSRFIVRLPLPTTNTAPTPSTSTDTNTTQSPTRRILVVDDNEDAAYALSMLLRLAGHQMHVAFSGAAALNIGKTFLPEVILMDIGMPVMNGLETARLVRQQDWGKNVLLVAVTGWGQHEDKRQTKEAGFDHHLVKPIKASDLEALLSSR